MPEDAAQICAIYNRFVRDTIVTFEEVPVTAEVMAGRIASVRARFSWLVLEKDGAVLGYAYAAPWKDRASYRFAVESAIYLAPEHAGRGLGEKLYRALLAELPACNVHCVIAGISLPNAPSIALHEKVGFKKIAVFEQVGWKLERWIDVGYWELIFP